MSYPEFFYRPGELFNIIFQTNLTNTQIEKIPTEDQINTSQSTQTTTTTPAQNQNQQTQNQAQVEEAVTPSNVEDKELSYSELFSADQQQKIKINRYKWKSNQSNTIDISGSKKYQLNTISENFFPYTLENAYNRYIEITKNNSVEPFTFFSDTQSIVLQKSSPKDIDSVIIQQCKFEIESRKIDILVPLYVKENVTLWKVGPTKSTNLAKINQIFRNPDNVKNFRRIVKLMGAILIREVGHIGSRYNGNKALMQLEYAAVCWAIINQTLSRGFGCNGNVIKLLESHYTLNIDKKIDDKKFVKMFQNDPDKLVKGKATDPNDPLYNTQETDDEIEARENTNILNTDKYKKVSGRQNIELYVMAFFEGLINDEFDSSTNWSHMQNKDTAFEISGFRIPKKETIDGKVYPRLLTDGDNAESSFPDNINISYGKVYTMIDSQGKPNVLISKGIQ